MKTVKLMIKYGQLILINGCLIQGDIIKVKLKGNMLFGIYGETEVSKSLSGGYWK